jgi:hypothetical protein
LELTAKACVVVRVAHRDSIRQIVLDALDVFDTRSRRTWWMKIKRLRGGGRRYKLGLEGPQLFQQLLYETSSSREVASPADEDAEESLLIGRYLQHVLAECLGRGAAWVAVGIGQLLFAYTASEVDDFVGRKFDRQQKKRSLMTILRRRFPDLKEVKKGRQDETHFDARADQQRYTLMIWSMLRALTPWLEHENQLAPYERREWRRCREFIEPDAFERLVRAKGLASPKERLRVPRLTVH